MKGGDGVQLRTPSLCISRTYSISKKGKANHVAYSYDAIRLRGARRNDRNGRCRQQRTGFKRCFGYEWSQT